jgi:phosphoribosylanthranilate isomerase
LDQTEEIKNLQSQVPQMKGIDINSKFEIEPALKDLGLIKEFKGKFE